MPTVQATRFRDAGTTLLSFVSDPILVVCPRCKSQAVVAPVHENHPDQGARIVGFKLTCVSCATAQTSGYHLQLTPTHDPVFGARLWLHTRTRHGELAVYNEPHLRYLEHFAAGTLRERSTRLAHGRPLHGWHNASMISRLPQWMKSAKHREDLQRACGKLRAML